MDRKKSMYSREEIDRLQEELEKERLLRKNTEEDLNRLLKFLDSTRARALNNEAEIEKLKWLFGKKDFGDTLKLLQAKLDDAKDKALDNEIEIRSLKEQFHWDKSALLKQLQADLDDMKTDALGHKAEITTLREQLTEGRDREAVHGKTKLRMACVMDEFTFNSYAPECDLCQLTPDNWQNEIESFDPEVLFIESAWRGKDDLWGSKIGFNSGELQDIVKWCKERKIPTLFWNKEDPIHFETFLTTAMQFDYIFTTDIDCIQRYKGALGHDRVYLLPFAAQPIVHNPIEKYDRKDAFCFAGAYYVRYPDRTRDLETFVSELSKFKPFEIYDRNFGKDDPNYMFPDEYKPYIVGTLKHSEIDKAYKGYNYAINLNSIKQSQTMFARRVFELLASNTITISNFSRGARLLFGDLVFTSDSGKELTGRLSSIGENESDVKKLRLSALRKVMMEHTYADRLAYIVSKLHSQPMEQLLPDVALLAKVQNIKSLILITEHFNRQSYEYKKLYIVLPDDLLKEAEPTDDIVMIAESQAEKSHIMQLIDEQWIACFAEEDYYGPNYLTDLVLATRYTEADVIGKASYYAFDSDGKALLVNPKERYTDAKELYSRSSMIKTDLVAEAVLMQWLDAYDKNPYRMDFMFSIDEFNYCQKGGGQEVSGTVDDLQGVDLGIGLAELIDRSEAIEPMEHIDDTAPIWDATMLSQLFRTPASKSVVFESDGMIFDVRSNLADDKHDYVYARKDFSPEELGYTDKVKYYLDTTPGLNIQVVTFFFDAENQRISNTVKIANRNQEVEIPSGTAKIRFGLRFYAGGSATIKGLVFGHRHEIPVEVIDKSKHLVLTNHYPSYENIYRNGFVHSRTKAYKEHGVDVDVFRFQNDLDLSYHEFENIDVITGSQDILRKMLSAGKYKSVLVHFLDEDMWSVLQDFIEELDVIVWIHGSEVQPWYRRDFNYNTDEERNDAKEKSDIRMVFWRKLLGHMPQRLKLVFVSQYFADEVMEDVGISLDRKQYEIIHNPIATDIFSYEEKDIEQRKKLLSIRPYASAKYANDLSVNAILHLKDKEWFKELDIRMIGDGALFDEILEPLKDFENVTIERRFLAQGEIASLHKQYGVFLTPTRMDAQGVSRDEAMSSGLIPITNAVTAIPEFVDDSCGILAPGDDAKAMADGIERLYYDAELFKKMSENATKRVHSQTSPEFTISAEIRLILNNE